LDELLHFRSIFVRPIGPFLEIFFPASDRLDDLSTPLDHSVRLAGRFFGGDHPALHKPLGCLLVSSIIRVKRHRILARDPVFLISTNVGFYEAGIFLLDQSNSRKGLLTSNSLCEIAGRHNKVAIV
jgi:hypothetical protein